MGIYGAKNTQFRSLEGYKISSGSALLIQHENDYKRGTLGCFFDDKGKITRDPNRVVYAMTTGYFGKKGDEVFVSMGFKNSTEITCEYINQYCINEPDLLSFIFKHLDKQQFGKVLYNINIKDGDRTHHDGCLIQISENFLHPNVLDTDFGFENESLHSPLHNRYGYEVLYSGASSGINFGRIFGHGIVRMNEENVDIIIEGLLCIVFLNPYGARRGDSGSVVVDGSDEEGHHDSMIGMLLSSIVKQVWIDKVQPSEIVVSDMVRDLLPSNLKSNQKIVSVYSYASLVYPFLNDVARFIEEKNKQSKFQPGEPSNRPSSSKDK